MSVSPMKDFPNSVVDLTKDAVYGVVQYPMTSSQIATALCDLKSGKLISEFANVNSGKDENMRKVNLWRVPVDSWIGSCLKDIIIDLNKTFNYKISNIQDIQYLEYGEGDFYKMHSDISMGVSAMRKISISWVLNDDFEGGQLKIMNGGEEFIVENRPDRLIAFTSFFTHGVMPITRGKRKVIVCWVNGEQWR